MSKNGIRKICVVGERVSGTSFVQKLFVQNTKLAPVYPFGHKHFFQDIKLIRRTETKNTLFVFVSRDIIEWLNSLLVNTYHAHLPIRNCNDMTTFIRMEWQCVFDKTFAVKRSDSRFGKEMMCERDPVDGKRFSNVIRMRNSKMKHFLSLKNEVENFVHLRYEDLRDFPEEFLSGVCEMFEIPKNPMFLPVTTVRGKGSVPYQRKIYPDISEKDLEFIFDNIDVELEKELEYMET